MDIKEYTRKTFSVNAVEVTLENYEKVAEWCGGTVEMVTTRLIGVQTKLPVVKITEQGNKGKEFVATLGCYVVELKGSFRVYKPTQFNDSFEEKEAEYASYAEIAASESHQSDLGIYDSGQPTTEDGPANLKLVAGENS